MTTGLFWFRRDLRLADNPALTRAVAECDRLLCLYLHDPAGAAPWPEGAASRWWLRHSLAALHRELGRRGSRLVFLQGAAGETLTRIATETEAGTVYWNRRYEPFAAGPDETVQRRLEAAGVRVVTENAALLHEPWQGVKADGTPYRVFTPFWRSRLREGFPLPGGVPQQLPPPAPGAPRGASLETLSPGEDPVLADHWRPGEAGAHQRLEGFLDVGLADYADDRDRPDREGTSRLSPHLHFGEIGPRQIAAAVRAHAAAQGSDAGVEPFLRQLGWREFAYHLLHHFPDTPDTPLDRRFEQFRWTADPGPLLDRWQRGQTGFPIVDAGLRELRQTGWMHNRVRMLAASLLTKNLLVPWPAGAHWFWDRLVDADLANNTLGWQWVAGCGADAAPYFRIFNPVTQGERFDPQGRYVRRWLPELAHLPDRWLHRPWQAPDPPGSYPSPLVDLRGSRERALERFARIRSRKR